MKIMACGRRHDDDRMFVRLENLQEKTVKGLAYIQITMSSKEVYRYKPNDIGVRAIVYPNNNVPPLRLHYQYNIEPLNIGEYLLLSQCIRTQYNTNKRYNKKTDKMEEG